MGMLRKQPLRLINGEQPEDVPVSLNARQQYTAVLRDTTLIVSAIARMTRESLGGFSKEREQEPDPAYDLPAYVDIARRLREGLEIGEGGSLRFFEGASPEGRLIFRLNKPDPATIIIRPGEPKWSIEAPKVSITAMARPINPFVAPPAVATHMHGKRVGDLSEEIGVILQEGNNGMSTTPLLPMLREGWQVLFGKGARPPLLGSSIQHLSAVSYPEACEMIGNANRVLSAGRAALSAYIEEHHPRALPRSLSRSIGTEYDDLPPAG